MSQNIIYPSDITCHDNTEEGSGSHVHAGALFLKEPVFVAQALRHRGTSRLVSIAAIYACARWLSGIFTLTRSTRINNGSNTLVS